MNQCIFKRVCHGLKPHSSITFRPTFLHLDLYYNYSSNNCNYYKYKCTQIEILRSISKWIKPSQNKIRPRDNLPFEQIGMYAPFCSSSKEENKKNIKIEQDAPTNVTSDCIGPPDPISSIPRVHFYIPPNETDTEKQFRLRRMRVLDWNHKFWSAHNEKFFKEKEEYIKNHQNVQDGKKKKLNPEEIAIFYKNFLNINRAVHLNYNKEWYKKNFTLLWPSLKVASIRLVRKLSKKKSE